VGELSIVSFLFLEVCPDSRKSDQLLNRSDQYHSALIGTDQN
jgi:hypothetical protein